MVNATLHYYFDPLCGWCYGAAPLIVAAAKLGGLHIALHGGGMLSGDASQPVTPQWRHYVMQHDTRIRQMTGQPFGDDYFNGLLSDATAVFDSSPPTLAIMATQAMGADPLTMLHQLQQAHYVHGKRIADADVLLQIAADMGLEKAGFASAMQQQAAQFNEEVGRNRQQMAQFGLQGFPSLMLESGGQWQRVDLSPYLGRPDDFAVHLQSLLAGDVKGGQGDGAFCTPGGQC